MKKDPETGPGEDDRPRIRCIRTQGGCSRQVPGALSRRDEPRTAGSRRPRGVPDGSGR